MKKKIMDAVLLKVGRNGILNKGYSVSIGNDRCIFVSEKNRKSIGLFAQRLRTVAKCSAEVKTFADQSGKEIIFASPNIRDIKSIIARAEFYGLKAHIFIEEF